MAEEGDEIISLKIMNRASRLAQLLERGAPELVIRAEWELLCRAYYRWRELVSRREFERLIEEEAAKSESEPKSDA